LLDELALARVRRGDGSTHTAGREGAHVLGKGSADDSEDSEGLHLGWVVREEVEEDAE